MSKLIEVLEPNKEVLAIIEELNGTYSRGDIQALKPTNLKVINPIIYKLGKEHENLLVCEYKNEVKNSKYFYIPTIKKAFSLKEIKQYLNALK